MNLSELFKALGDENRIRILSVLMQKALCVCEIELILKISQSNASRHLNKLRSMGIIYASKKAQWVSYEIDEKFKEHHSLIYEYLKIEIKNIAICNQDLQRLQKYTSSSYTCEHLGEEHQEILNYLEQ